MARITADGALEAAEFQEVDDVRRILPSEQWLYPEFNETSGPILDTAVWHVDAGAVADDRLIDLSGGGRDAVFGADAARPRALPWDGEDYFYFPLGAGQAPKADFSTQPAASVVVNFRAMSEMDPSFGNRALFEVGAAANDDRGISLAYDHVNNRFIVRWPNAVDYAGNVPWTMGDQMRTYRFVMDGDTATLHYLDGGEWVHVLTSSSPTGTITLTNRRFRYWGCGTTSYAAQPGRLAFMEVLFDGDAEPTERYDPANVNAAMNYVANTGTLGGGWNLARPASGYKTAVVTRPTLLFGGGQIARAEQLPTDLVTDDCTVLVAQRRSDVSTVYTYLLDLAYAGATTHGLQFLYHSNGRFYSAVKASTVTNLNQPQPVGGHVLGCRLTSSAARAEMLIDGAVATSANSIAWPTSNRSTLTIGATNVAAVGSAGEFEFHAAVIFDRALTDEEVARATEELQGGRVAATRPTMYARELREISLLGTAAWHVDAAHVAGDRLVDLSGGGRDAIFGADTARPKVLPWDGDDYYVIPYNASVANHLNLNPADTVPLAGETWYAEMDLEVIEWVTGTYHGLIYGGGNRPVLVYVTSSGRFLVGGGPSGGYRVTATNLWVQGERATFRFECEAATGTVRTYKNGALVDSGTFANPVDYTGSAPSLMRFGSAYHSAHVALYAGAEIGVVGAGGDEPRVRLVASQDGKTWTNPITGSTSTINRAASGYKTVVVTRPALLFGGGQVAKVAERLPTVAGGMTVVAAFRTFTTAADEVWLDTRTTSGVGNGFLVQWLGTAKQARTWLYWQSTRPSAIPPSVPLGQVVVVGRADGTDSTQWTNSNRADQSDIWSGGFGGAYSSPVSVGAHSGGGYMATGEFLAAVVFDRALTDDEVVKATKELLGVQRTVVYPDGGS